MRELINIRWHSYTLILCDCMLSNIIDPLNRNQCFETFRNCFGLRPSDWVGLTLIWDVYPSCQPAQPLLPISHQPRQNYHRVELDKSKSAQLSGQPDDPSVVSESESGLCPCSFLIVTGLWVTAALILSLRRRGALDVPLKKWWHFQRSMGFDVSTTNNSKKGDLQGLY